MLKKQSEVNIKTTNTAGQLTGPIFISKIVNATMICNTVDTKEKIKEYREDPTKIVEILVGVTKRASNVPVI